MGNISLESVQKLLHLDVDYPQFKSYVLNLEFMVDGVTVHAIANVSWRYIQVNITDPYQILAYDFQPPLFALQISAIRRREVMEKRGITETDDFIERCKIAYHRHLCYLRIKPTIDIALNEFMSVFGDELASLEAIDATVRARVVIEKSELRKKYKVGQIDQKTFQNSLKQLTKEESDANYPYSVLSRQVEMELDDIKDSMIDLSLSEGARNA